MANKCLNPVSLPQNNDEVLIEHALAREAIRMALVQHQEMHYNNSKIGYLDKLKSSGTDKYELMFEYTQTEEKFYFRKSDIDVIIGAGGIFAQASHPSQCVLTLIDALCPKGITEICIDKDFTTPHLGVLDTAAPKLSGALLPTSIQKLAVHVAPIIGPHSKKNKAQTIS